jgi:hypothetical protein
VADVFSQFHNLCRQLGMKSMLPFYQGNCSARALNRFLFITWHLWFTAIVSHVSLLLWNFKYSGQDFVASSREPSGSAHGTTILSGWRTVSYSSRAVLWVSRLSPVGTRWSWKPSGIERRVFSFKRQSMPRRLDGAISQKVFICILVAKRTWYHTWCNKIHIS